MCFVYAIAFLGAFLHNTALVGSRGLLPASVHLKRVASHFGTSRHEMLSLPCWDVVYYASSPSDVLPSTIRAFRAAPTLFWWVPDASLDWAMEMAAVVGLLVALLGLLCGRSNMILMLSLWALYFSIVSVGQSFYSFGWESQLLETGMIAVFLVKPLSFSKPNEMPVVPMVLLRWLLFRVMLGSGLIKLRGDQCWRSATCMEYFYQTQPNPNPLARLFHASPKWVHTGEVWVNHFVELVAPFFVALPQPAASIGGLLQIAFQVTIIASGNLSFLNWLTIVPALACMDERLVQRLCFWRRGSRGGRSTSTPTAGALTESTSQRRLPSLPWTWYVRYVCTELPTVILHWSFALLIVYLSMPVVGNMLELSGQQAMNTNYDWLRLVNTHGNFGSVTRTRMEVTVEGRSTTNPRLWLAYEFPCKPGADLHRRPCFASPFHYRLDWLMWFAGFQRIEQAPWLVHLALKALQAKHDATARAVLHQLSVEDPFLSRPGDYPMEVRMRIQEYQLQPIALHNATRVAAFLSDVAASVWHRNRTLSAPYWRVVGASRSYLDAMNEDRLVHIVQQFLL